MRLLTAVPVFIALLAAGCGDLGTAPADAPAPAAADFHAELRCTVTVARGTLACGAEGEVADGSGPRRSLIIGGQNVYVRVMGSNVSSTPADSLFQLDVEVQNLMTQVFGSPDGEVDTGLRIFFASQPTASAGSGTVEVHNEDGEAVFISAPTPYFDHEGLLFTGDTSAAETWQFKVDPGVDAFVFTVYVQGEMPHEASLLRFTPSNTDESSFFNGIWGASDDEVFAVGDFGALARYTDGAWTDDTGVTDAGLMDVWGSSASDVFVVGEAGTIVHWDGTAWEEMDSGLGCTCMTLWGVGGAAADDVWAVGDGGVIVHFDGDAWTPVDTVPTPGLTGVWAATPDDAFAVGFDGAIFHYDGTDWTAMTSGLEGTGAIFLAVWGFSSTSVYAMGDAGVLHYDGSDWSPLVDELDCPVFGMWGSSESDLFFAAGCTIEHWDGSTWSQMDPGGFVTELWGSGPLDVWANSDNYVFRGTR